MTLNSKVVGRPVGGVTENTKAGTEERPYAHCWQVADFLRIDSDELQRIVREYRGPARFRRENFIPAKAISDRRSGKGPRDVPTALAHIRRGGLTIDR